MEDTRGSLQIHDVPCVLEPLGREVWVYQVLDDGLDEIGGYHQDDFPEYLGGDSMARALDISSSSGWMVFSR
jgi:hypothetical protein